MLHSITTEAEYVALAEGVKKARYMRGILAFLMPRLGVDEHWRVRGQPGGDRLRAAPPELVR